MSEVERQLELALASARGEIAALRSTLDLSDEAYADLAVELATANGVIAKLLPSGDGYIIVTFKHGYAGDCLVMWKPDGAGYTGILSEAGVFTWDEAKEVMPGAGYCFAVPVDKARELAVTVLNSERGANRIVIEKLARAAAEAAKGEVK